MTLQRLPALALLISLYCPMLPPALAAGGPPAGVPAHARDNGATETANKAQVARLYQLMGSDAGVRTLGGMFAHDLIQHDPQLADGRNAMVDWIAGLRRNSPALAWTVKHVVADRDLVFVHAHVGTAPANEWSGSNRYDIYRLDQGIIVEHWAVAAPAPTRSASGNTAFNDAYRYTGGAPSAEPRMAELNRLLAQSLSEDVFGKRRFALLDRFWAAGYLQHNPYVPNGRAALAGVLPYIAPEGGSYRVAFSMAEGDLALVCAHATEPGADPAGGVAVCDLYRMVNYEMVEHWDVAQPVPGSSVNGHTMFSSLYGKHGHARD